MKKRLLTVILALVAALCLCFGLAGCGGGNVLYTLIFIVDDEVYATIDTGGEEAITMPSKPTKEDYIFDGWYWDKEIWQRPFTADSLLHEKLTSDMSVYAKWLEEDITKKSYTVTFNSMGGSSVEKASVVYNNLLAEPAKPTRTGYVFVGWYKEADCSTKWDFAADTVTKDFTLYAKWVDESDATGSDILAAEGFTISGNILSVKVPHAQEYFVLSEAITVSPYATWTASSDIDGNIVIPSAAVSLNVGDNTYYINITSGNGTTKKQYTVNIRRREIYTVTYQPNNGDADIVVQVEEDQKLENKKVGKTGYSFTEWQYQDAAWDFGQEISESMTLTAAWQANSYTVTFDSAEGSTVDETTATYDAEFKFKVPTRKGYAFNGWKTADGTLLTDGEGNGKDVWKIADNTELTADWTVIEYTITYHGVDDALNENPTRYTVESGNITLSNASKTGYYFLGWFNAENDGRQVAEIVVSEAENVELWARWMESHMAYVELYNGEELYQQLIVEDKVSFELSFPDGYSDLLPCWEDDDGVRYTDILGNGIKELPQHIRLYLQTEYQPVRSVQELAQIKLSGMYKLMQDIDLGGAEWTPIGTDRAPFVGIFDGNGHTIKNFKLTALMQYVGLFGVSGGIIRNLCVENFSIDISVSSSSNVGGLVGYNNGGMIANCCSAGDVTVSIATSSSSYTADAGGLVGFNNGAIAKCYATGDVTASAPSSSSSSYRIYDASAGGLVGSNSGTIRNCYATGNVTATSSSSSSAGGLVGSNGGTIRNCYATGNVTARATTSSTSKAYAGGLAGENSGTIHICYATGNVTARATLYSAKAYAGGLVGIRWYTGDDAYCYRYSRQIVTAQQMGSNGTINTDGGTVSLETLQSESFPQNTLGWDPSIWEFNSNSYPVFKKEQSAASIVYIREKEELASLEGTSLNADFYLASDIDLEMQERRPMNLYGVFLGNGHTIKNFRIVSAAQYAGLFGMSKGVIRDLGVENFTIDPYSSFSSTSTYAGGLVGYNNGGTITNCYATGDVIATVVSSSSVYSCTANAGGLVGYSKGGTITNCYATGDVTATENTFSSAKVYAGGLAGYNYGSKISNCYATGNVTATTDTASVASDDLYVYAGGLVGYSSTTIVNCYATGAVMATPKRPSVKVSVYAGGLVGYGGTITNCYATGDVTATAWTTSASSSISTLSASSYAGGLVGYGGTMKNCYATGNVTATTNSNVHSSSISSATSKAYAGGLVGYGGTITDCYATGNVTATTDSSSLTSTSVLASSYAGGLVGYRYNSSGNTITNCYRYNRQTVEAIQNGRTIGTVSTDGTAKDLSYLQSESFLKDTLGWDPSVWEFHDSAYPTLKF